LNFIKKTIWHAIPPGSRYEFFLRSSWLRIKLFFRLLGANIPGYIARNRAKRYQIWVERNTPEPEFLLEQTRTKFQSRPVFGLLLPVQKNTQFSHIQQTIDSMQMQTYGNWLISIGSDRELALDTQFQLSRLCSQDSRIQFHISQASYASALAEQESDYVVCINPGDRLSPSLLFEFVQILNKKPEIDLIYMDVDRLDMSGNRVFPWFKPDTWSPEMLLSVNYLAHASIKTSLVKAAGGFDKDLKYAEEWDLMLRCIELTQNISHLAKILYHELAIIDLNQAWQDCSTALERHLQRAGLEAPKSFLVDQNTIRVTWQPSQSRVSILIPNKDSQPILKRCIDSIINNTAYPSYEIVIVDNGSTDPRTLAYYQELSAESWVNIVSYPETFNYSKAINLGAKNSSGDYLLILNNDVEALAPDWLEEMVRWADRPETGVVGAKLLYSDNRIQHAGIVTGLYGFVDHIFSRASEHESGMFGSVDWYRDFTAVTGACQMIRKEVYSELGGYDERYQLVFSDVDFCLRALPHYRVVYTPFALLRHHERQSRGHYEPLEDIVLAMERLDPYLKSGDPYYNPNLTTTYWPDCRLDEPKPIEQRKRLLGRLKAARLKRVV
jgi:O-antigen biosynthesis protein